MLNKDKTEHIIFSKEVFQSDYKFVERSKILGLWFERDLSFKTHAAIITASVVNFWKETSILITQVVSPFYAVRIFDSHVKPRFTYCMTIWFHQTMTSLDKLWWSVHKFVFGIRNYRCNSNSSNIQIVEKCKAIQFLERIPYQRLFSFGLYFVANNIFVVWLGRFAPFAK